MTQSAYRMAIALSVATLAAVGAFGPTAARADVRVWTDQQEVILKGTLRGIEVIDGAGGTAAPPAAASDGDEAPEAPTPSVAAEPLRTITVSSANDLYKAVNTALPGDRIVVAPGVYVIEHNSIGLKMAGTPENPIVVTAAKRGDATLRMTGENGFLIAAPHWIVENLVIEGACVEDTTCEHAFHIVDDADHTIVRNNRVVDFNAPIKGNGRKRDTGWSYPDHVLIENNDFYNTRPRQTENPVTGIDVVGGTGWIVRGNYLADFGKMRGNRTSYAAFFKGGSTNGTFERNLVVCGRSDDGDRRVGLSFGGGGTNLDRFCGTGDCAQEHRGGTMRNNIILACNDVGIYLNRARDSRIFNNMLYRTDGIDVRFAESTADIRNNILSGTIMLRDGAEATRRNNVVVASPVQFNTWFADPGRYDFSLINRSFFVDKGEPVPNLADDFCGHTRRAEPPDMGPIEFADNRPCNVLERMNSRD